MCIFDKIREHFRPINIGPFRAIPRQSDGMVLLRGVVTIFQHISGNIYIFRHLIPVYVHDRPSFYRWFHVRNREVKFLAGYSIQPNEQSFILWCAGNVATFTIAECQLSLPPSEDFVATDRRLVEGFFLGASVLALSRVARAWEHVNLRPMLGHVQRGNRLCWHGV